MEGPKESRYLSYLLRMWQEQPDAPWRATLHNPHTGDQRHFATLGHLFAYLQEEVGGRPLPNSPANLAD